MNIKSIDQEINQIFSKYDGWVLSELSVNKLTFINRAMRYDESSTVSFLDAFAITKPQKTDIFLDLGSGLGKKVLAAALSEVLDKSIGIEWLDELCNTSISATDKLLKSKKLSTKIEFILGDYYKLDFSCATIIHISVSPTMMDFQLKGKLGDKLRELRRGTRIIISEVKIPFPEFSLIETVDYTFPHRTEQAFIYTKIK